MIVFLLSEEVKTPQIHGRLLAQCGEKHISEKYGVQIGGKVENKKNMLDNEAHSGRPATSTTANMGFHI